MRKKRNKVIAVLMIIVGLVMFMYETPSYLMAVDKIVNVLGWQVVVIIGIILTIMGLFLLFFKHINPSKHHYKTDDANNPRGCF